MSILGVCLLWQGLSALLAPAALPVAAESARDRQPPYLRLPLNGDIETLDPGLAADTSALEVVEQMFLALTDFNPETYAAIPELATDWSASEDSKTYVFNLRKDALWSNGQPVTAHDVVWAVQRNLDPKLNSPYAASIAALENAEAISQGEIKDMNLLGVHALNDYKVEFKLTYPTGYFAAMVSLSAYRPLPRKAIEEFGADWTQPAHIVTNGPYTLAEREPGQVLVLRKNPHYYDAAKTAIGEVRYLIIPENSLGLSMYRNHELDILGGPYLQVPGDEVLNVKQDAVLRKQWHTRPDFCTQYYGFNVIQPPADNPLVRKAIAAAIDKRLLIDVVIKGDQIAASTFTRPPIFGSVAPGGGVGIEFDPIQARAWLSQAGYPDGKNFPHLLLMHDTSEFHAENAKAIKTMLKHYLNIEVDIQHKEFSEYQAYLGSPDQTVNMFRYGWCSDYPDANNWLFEALPLNFMHWDNPGFTQRVSDAQRVTDQDKRRTLYREAETLLNETDAAMVPLYFSTAQYLVNPRIQNWYHMAFGGQQIRNWALQP